ncbi:hypothetical protein BOO31_16025 [Vibrio navarrensis]|nr:hypothetical protein [Vibrio navarrensis]
MLGKSRDEEKQGRKSKSGREGPRFWALGPGKGKGGRARAEEKVLGSGPLVLGKEKAGKAGNEFARG